MAICPKCRAKGATVEGISRSVGEDVEVHIYCNTCGNDSFVPSRKELVRDIIEKFNSKRVTEPHRLRQAHKEYSGSIYRTKQEEPTMKVSYKGFTGILMNLRGSAFKKQTILGDSKISVVYDIEIFDESRNVTYSFKDAKAEDIKFLGGSVSFE